MKCSLLALSLSIATLGVTGHAQARSICASTQRDPSACLKKFGIPDGAQPDVVIVGRIEKDRWTFEHGLKPQPGHADARFCRYRGDLTLRKGSRVELWIIADRGIHQWSVPTLRIDQSAMDGTYQPVPVDTAEAGVFASVPDAKKRKPPSIRILEPAAYVAWARKALGRTCAAAIAAEGRS